MKTICIQIGNSDDKLTQAEWASFVSDVAVVVDRYGSQTHFTGGSSPAAVWQNYCFVAEVEVEKLTELFAWLSVMRDRYGQDSIATMIGETVFI